MKKYLDFEDDDFKYIYLIDTEKDIFYLSTQLNKSPQFWLCRRNKMYDDSFSTYINNGELDFGDDCIYWWGKFKTDKEKKTQIKNYYAALIEAQKYLNLI